MWLVAGRQLLSMVGVAQLVELRIVAPAVVGSNPIAHPKFQLQVTGETSRVSDRRYLTGSLDLQQVDVLLRAVSSAGRAGDS